MKKFICLLLLIATTHVQSQNFEIYVSDAGNFNAPPWQILKFDENGQNGSVFINSNLNWPQDILFVEDSNFVLVSNLGSGKITKHNAATGVFISNFANAISGPTRIKIGPDGFLYVLQWNGNGKVRRYEMNGNLIDEFTDIGVPQSIGMDWDIDGNLYVSSYSGAYVRKFDFNGMDMGLFINTNLLGPTNIWFDTNGDLLVSDYNGTAVKRFNSSGIYIGDYLTGLNQSEGVAIFPNGNVLVGNGATHSVKMFDNNGAFIQDLIPSGAVNLLNPNAVVLRPVTNVALPEDIGLLAAVIYPTVGSQFYVSNEFQEKIKTISVFNSIGKQVINESLLSSSRLFEKHELDQGLYIARITLFNGQEIVQKLLVR